MICDEINMMEWCLFEQETFKRKKLVVETLNVSRVFMLKQLNDVLRLQT